MLCQALASDAELDTSQMFRIFLSSKDSSSAANNIVLEVTSSPKCLTSFFVQKLDAFYKKFPP